MTTEEKMELFSRCFHGLTHTYGTYSPTTGRSWQVKAPVIRQTVLRHLQGKQPYGVYLLQNRLTSAIAADFDDHDANPPLDFLRRLRHYGIPAYMERSKSKGYHVWVFFKAPGEDSGKARALFLSVLEEIGHPRTEVFPKQNTIDVDAGEVGNFINAPLFGALVPKGRTVFLDHTGGLRPYPDQWEVLKGIERVSPAQLDGFIELNGLETPSVGGEESETLGIYRSVSGMPPCARHMLEAGVRDFQRVSCFRLAVELRRVGMPYDLAVDVLIPWARKNRPPAGKRVITETEVKAQTAAAYLKHYRGHGCDEPAVVPYCDPGCPLYARGHSAPAQSS